MTITEAADMSFKNGMRQLHPGEVLREDFMRPSRLTANLACEGPACPPHHASTISFGSEGESQLTLP